MSNFDEFVSDNLGDIQRKVSAAKTGSEPKFEAVGVAVKPKSMRNLSLSLNDRSNMSISQDVGEVFGIGSAATGNKMEKFGAFGKRGLDQIGAGITSSFQAPSFS
jgi:hypothetical protein